MGARHALFPRFTGIGRPHHPSSDCWLPVPRRCVIPQERLRLRFGPAAEPDTSVTTGFLLGEASLLGFALVCRHSQSEHGSVVIEIFTSIPVAQGRHRILASSIVCLRQRVLSLNPQVAFSCLKRTAFLRPPALRILLRFHDHRPYPDASHLVRSLREAVVPFPVVVATPLRSNSVSFVQTVGLRYLLRTNSQ